MNKIYTTQYRHSNNKKFTNIHIETASVRHYLASSMLKSQLRKQCIQSNIILQFDMFITDIFPINLNLAIRVYIHN